MLYIILYIYYIYDYIYIASRIGIVVPAQVGAGAA